MRSYTGTVVEPAQRWLRASRRLNRYFSRDAPFSASLGLDRLKQRAQVLQRDEQSALRQTVIPILRERWQTQVTEAAAVTHRSIHEVMQNFLSPESLKEVRQAIAGHTDLDPGQKYALEILLACLDRRARRMEKYIAQASARAERDGADRNLYIARDLLSINPVDPVRVVWESGVAIEIYLSRRDYESFEQLNDMPDSVGGAFVDRASQLPVIIVKTTKETDNTRDHELVHSLHSAFTSSQHREGVYPAPVGNSAAEKRLAVMIREIAMPFAIREMAAYLFTLRPTNELDWQQIQNILKMAGYDFLSRNRRDWGMGGHEFDAVIDKAHARYLGELHQAVQTAYAIHRDLKGVDHEQLVVLLVALPPSQWRHLLTENTVNVRVYPRIANSALYRMLADVSALRNDLCYWFGSGIKTPSEPVFLLEDMEQAYKCMHGLLSTDESMHYGRLKLEKDLVETKVASVIAPVALAELVNFHQEAKGYLKSVSNMSIYDEVARSARILMAWLAAWAGSPDSRGNRILAAHEIGDFLAWFKKTYTLATNRWWAEIDMRPSDRPSLPQLEASLYDAALLELYKKIVDRGGMPALSIPGLRDLIEEIARYPVPSRIDFGEGEVAGNPELSELAFQV